MAKPKVAILITDGTNCDEETSQAFTIAGAKVDKVHINNLLKKGGGLNTYQILVIPGGFTYGDDVMSAKILANQLLYRLGEQINNFISQDKLILGICNGFQALVRAGFLPWKMKPAEDCSLIFNDSGHLECRWIRLIIGPTSCVFTNGMQDKIIEIPVAHGEGKFIVKNNKVLEKIQNNNLICCQYVDKNNNLTQKYPDNPNGSIYSIAGVCDKSGRIFGLMPHPERAIFFTHLPHWTYLKEKYQREGKKVPKFGPGLQIFQNAVEYFN